jgi:hypothetical protein
MTALDAELGPLGLELIAEFGKVVGYRRITTGAYNPDTASAPKTEAATVSIHVIVEDANSSLAQMVEGASKKLTVSALAVPNPQDNLDEWDIDGETLTALKTNAIYSGDNICIYEVWVGK